MGSMLHAFFKKFLVTCHKLIASEPAGRKVCNSNVIFFEKIETKVICAMHELSIKTNMKQPTDFAEKHFLFSVFPLLSITDVFRVVSFWLRSH